MFSFFRRRVFLVVLGFLLIAVFIWFAGPYFAFGQYRPLETETSRLVAIALVVVFWIGWRLVKRLRAFRASDLLAAAVLRQAHPQQGQPPADVVRLRERFEEAVATLKTQRHGGHSLYDLPWYVIIGAPGSGKTTALLNSGLKFPLEQRVGKGALRGVGGTRNCDWWFTDEAILLDTAGRYTTQDSDASSDAAGWSEFLTLLKKYRKRRPVNGVILTISAADLMVQSDLEREAQFEAARRRLNELNRELSIQLPVYLMVTKCDLVAGFTQYFDDLTQEARAQVWGVTFPYEQTVSGEATQAFPAEFEALMARLNERLFARLEEDRDVRRRAAVFAFPQQMAALRDVLAQFVSEVFASTRLEQPILLRGVYFTSGTQEGTPIDRLLGSIGRRFGVAADAVAPPTGRGKAYFVERLLKDVMIGESGLAGLNRRLEVKKAAAQLGAYAALALIAVIGVVVLSVSASRNRAYVTQVSSAIEQLRQVPPVGPTASLQTLLPRLDAMRAVVDAADQYRDDTPWRMRWGLYQGTSLGNSARDAYVRELDGALLPRVAARLRERLMGKGTEPEILYEYLKAYLMLGDPRRLDKKYLQELAQLGWQSGGGLTRGAGDSLTKHFQSLLEYGETLRPIALDASLVSQVRSSIRQASIPRIMYGRLKRRYADDTGHTVRLDVAGGVGVEQMIRRASGRSLSEPLPSLFTRSVFKEATTVATLELVKQFAEDSWVWGESSALANNPVKLAADVIDLYERDYIAAWETVLRDLKLVSFPTVRETSNALEILAGDASPLRGVLTVVVEHTSLVDAPTAATPPSGRIEAAGKAITDRFGKLVKPLTDATGLPSTPGAFVTAHFQPIHRLMSGEAGNTPLDQILTRIGEVQQQLQSLGPEVGGKDPLEALSNPALRETLQSLRQEAAQLPPTLRPLVTEVGRQAEGTVVSGATSDLENRYREEVLQECAAIVTDRYPFAPESDRDVPLSDFGRLFGYDGVFDTFFRANLQPLVDTSRRPWAWRPGSVHSSHGMLDQFEAAQRIRGLFFRPDAGSPSLRFNLTLGDTDAAASRFVLEIDGVYFDYRRGPKRIVPAAWPGPTPGSAAVTFEDRSGPRPGLAFRGPWAWFRLVDAVSSQRETDTRYVLTFQTGGHQGRVEVEAASVRNPFANRDWQRFSCGS